MLNINFMSDAKLQSYSFAVLRAPLQSLDDAYRIHTEFSPIFQEGLYLSSPEFWQELQKAGDGAFNKEKIKQSLFKYWIRSSTRCTPYGTFAGCSIANITDEATNFILKNKDQHVRYIRLDMNYMANIIFAISKVSPIVEQLKFSPNNSIYYLPNSIRYAEYTIQNNTRHYHLASVQKTNYLLAVLEKAASGGGATISDLGSLIIDIEDVTEEEARTFVLSLWQSQILVSELEPAVTGKEPLDRFIEQLSSFKGIEHLVFQLKDIQYLLQHPKSGVQYYQGIESKLRNLVSSFVIPKNTLQLDLFLSTEYNNINKPLIESILTQVSDLLLLARPGINPDLDSFGKKFYSKYEQSEVPLNIVLDSDIGIGYAGVTPDISGSSDLVEDIFNKAQEQSIQSEDYIVQYVFSKYHDFLKNRKENIEIEEHELKSFMVQTEQLSFSDSMYIQGDLLKKDGKLDADNFVFDLSSFGGTSAGNLLGRFTHGDRGIFRATKEILRQEEPGDPDTIFAEIAHLPQARIGNVLLRPILRDYEIPYIGKSGISPDRQIAVDDLMVSIKNKEIVLRSKRLNKRIIPRLTTAHNFGFGNLPIYKFLCDLQGQNLAFPNAWDWGSLINLKYLPRVVYKNIIIKKARWRIDEADVKDLPKDTTKYKDYLESFRNKLNIPERVAYKEGDNELLVDFNEESGILLFIHYLKRFKSILIEEFLFNTSNCIVNDTNGRPFASEIIIPVRHQKTFTKNQTNFEHKENERIDVPSAKRKYSIYSEWLYFKIYCGPKMAENLLSGALLSFIDQKENKNLFEYFFFIRYKDDSGNHLRLRFFNKDLNKQLSLLKEIMLVLQPYVDDGLVERVVIDSYFREIERYGDSLIEQAEQLFYNDSLAVMRFINLLDDSSEPEKYKLLFAVRGIDIFLSDFNLKIDERVELLKQIISSFSNEFWGDPSLQKQLNSKYRKYQQSIFSHMDNVQDIKNEIEEAVSIFKIRSDMNAPVIQNLVSKLSLNPKKELFKLLPSYIHMFINRLFIANQRKYELVVCHFLDHYYSSLIAIKRKKVAEKK